MIAGTQVKRRKTRLLESKLINPPMPNLTHILLERDKKFDEKFVDKEGCQANHPSDFECTLCKMWGGREGVPKMHKRPRATSGEIKEFIQQDRIAVVEGILKGADQNAKDFGGAGVVVDYYKFKDFCDQALSALKSKE